MITCFCITYLRERLLEEAIYSFLNQTYKGEKELLILNDAEEQELVFDHPEVRIINLKTRFPTIGEKADEAIRLSKYDILSPWDDDDISLPWRLEFTLDKIKDCDNYKSRTAFEYSVKDKVFRISKNRFYGSSIFTRELFNKTSGNGKVNSSHDAYLENQFPLHGKVVIDELEHPYFIYRWGGIRYHLSAFGGKENALDLISAGRGATSKKGRIQLQPKWNEDYIKLCEDFQRRK